VSEEHEAKMYLAILHSIFINTVKIVEELRTGAGMTAEDIQKIQALESIIKYFENTTDFLRIVDAAIEPMKSLLFSQTMSDTHEAIHFFVTAYQFQIDNASGGILGRSKYRETNKKLSGFVAEMLKMMRCSEQERKTAVVDAFKTIYLTTDTRNMA
jgi:hypothetical protein